MTGPPPEQEQTYADYLRPYLDRGWRQETCGRCRGFGVVSVYSMTDFEGPGECPSCGGGGTVWRTPKGRYALYPGGPFCG